MNDTLAIIATFSLLVVLGAVAAAVRLNLRALTDDQLTRWWRNTERFTEASMALALLLAIAGCPAVYNWPNWALLFIVPPWVASIVTYLTCLWGLRPQMDRRGLDWEAPIWWVR